MKPLVYPLIAVLLSASLYFGMSVTGKTSIQQPVFPTQTSHTVESHSRVEKSHSKSHSRVEATQLPELCVNTNVPDGYLNLRVDAGMKYAVITVLHEGDRVGYLSDKNGWKKVKLSSLVSGYVYSAYLSDCK